MTNLLFSVLPLELQKLLIRYCCPAVRYELKSLPLFAKFILVHWTNENDRLESICCLAKEKEYEQYCSQILMSVNDLNQYLVKKLAKNNASDILIKLHEKCIIRDSAFMSNVGYLNNIEICDNIIKSNREYIFSICRKCNIKTFQKLIQLNPGIFENFLPYLLKEKKVNDRFEKIKLLHENGCGYDIHIDFIHADFNTIKYVLETLKITTIYYVYIEGDNVLDTYNYCLNMSQILCIGIRNIASIDFDHLTDEKIIQSLLSFLDCNGLINIIKNVKTKSCFDFLLRKYGIDEVAKNIMDCKYAYFISDILENLLKDQIDEPYDIKMKKPYYVSERHKRNLLLLHKLQKSRLFNIKSDKFQMVYNLIESGVVHL